MRVVQTQHFPTSLTFQPNPTFPNIPNPNIAQHSQTIPQQFPNTSGRTKVRVAAGVDHSAALGSEDVAVLQGCKNCTRETKTGG